MSDPNNDMNGIALAGFITQIVITVVMLVIGFIAFEIFRKKYHEFYYPRKVDR